MIVLRCGSTLHMYYFTDSAMTVFLQAICVLLQLFRARCRATSHLQIPPPVYAVHC